MCRIDENPHIVDEPRKDKDAEKGAEFALRSVEILLGNFALDCLQVTRRTIILAVTLRDVCQFRRRHLTDMVRHRIARDLPRVVGAGATVLTKEKESNVQK